METAFSAMKHFFLTFTTAALAMGSCPASDWPQWRGPDGQGHAVGSGFPVKWSATENVRWKCDIRGRGWSSPVIEGGTAWVTTAEETPLSAPEKAERLKKNTGDQPLTVLRKVDLRAVGVDLTNGKVTHDVLLLSVDDPQWVHELNSYASPTPVIAKGRLYAHFGALGTACLDTATDKVVWQNRGLVVMHENGPGSSPVLWNDRLIFHMDGSDAQFVAALDPATGKVLWKTPRSGEMHPNPQLKKSYGTPLPAMVNGKEQLLSPGSNWLYAYDAYGTELWKLAYGGLGFSLTPRPVQGHGMLFMSTGFMKAEMLAIRLKGEKAPEIAWRSTKNVPTMPSPILEGDELYFVNDSGMLTCLDAKTGEERYRERIGGEYSASPTAAEGRLYFSNRAGVTTVVKSGPKFEVLATNALPGKILASMAAVDGVFYLRTDSALWAIGGAGGAGAARGAGAAAK